MSAPISFLSDFGASDEFVGVVHGVIARIAPEAKVIDITHGIEPGAIRPGALSLMRAIQYMPEGVALAIVDPGVGTERRLVAAETPWGQFVGPDNGLLSPAVAMVGGASKVVAIENDDLTIPRQGLTFDGRDRMAPAAALLASGEESLEDLGPAVPPESLVPLLLPLPEVIEESVTGVCWWADRFGNLQANVGPEDLAAIGLGQGSVVSFTVGSVKHRLDWVNAYGDVEVGQGLVHVDSYGMIAIAVRGGSAREDLGIDVDTPFIFEPG